jgi:hypothetical protein
MSVAFWPYNSTGLKASGKPGSLYDHALQSAALIQKLNLMERQAD